MATYFATSRWERGSDDFLDKRYHRRHLLRFDGGAQYAGSSSPHAVPPPCSDLSAVDPEEAFVASLSSCHLLWFLAIAAGAGFCVDHYEDQAEGVMGRNAEGRVAMLVVTLRPHVVFVGTVLPLRADIERMHDEAHDACFIANSVRCDVRCEPE